MSLALFLKNNLDRMPPFFGVLINHVPYKYRPGIGKIYKQRKEEIRKFGLFDINARKEFIFDKVKAVTKFAYENVFFYKDYYDKCSFDPNILKDFDDLKRIPIINKNILNGYLLDQRSSNLKNRYLVNTGGSSGTPFSLYIQPSSIGHEWAHMHTIWEKLNYKSTDLKLVFGGRSDVEELIQYDAVRNHFSVDIYAAFEKVSFELKKRLKKYRIKYLHGYPSAIYEFSLYCNNHDIELKEILSGMLEGAFLGSEFPQPVYRDMIENTFNIKSISWYGHTERSVLAYEESEKYVYEPFGTYGFAETIEAEDNNFLVSTSYYNYASPLIRYNTMDLVSNAKVEEGLVKSFEISRGREGEFVIDKNNKKINLTGLIFGRHHKLFNHATFIQVRQIEAGKIEINFVAPTLTEETARESFDVRNLNFDISFKKREEPVRTSSGKVNLLLK